MCAHHCANIERRMGLLLHPVIQKSHKENIDLKAKELERSASKSFEEHLSAWDRIHEACANIDKEIEGLDKLPLGRLISFLKKRTKLSDEYAKYLADILERRNYLIHKMWGKYGRYLSDPSSIKTMADELMAYEKDFREASNWLKKQVCLIHGVVDDQLMLPRKSFQISGRCRANPSTPPNNPRSR